MVCTEPDSWSLRVLIEFLGYLPRQQGQDVFLVIKPRILLESIVLTRGSISPQAQGQRRAFEGRALPRHISCVNALQIHWPDPLSCLKCPLMARTLDCLIWDLNPCNMCKLVQMREFSDSGHIEMGMTW